MLIPTKLYKWQEDCLDNLTGRDSIITGRRAGVTTLLLKLAEIAAAKPNKKVGFMARAWVVENLKKNKQLENVYFFSNAQALMGMRLDFLVIDESWHVYRFNEEYPDIMDIIRRVNNVCLTQNHTVTKYGFKLHDYRVIKCIPYLNLKKLEKYLLNKHRWQICHNKYANIIVDVNSNFSCSSYANTMDSSENINFKDFSIEICCYPFIKNNIEQADLNINFLKSNLNCNECDVKLDCLAN